MWTKVTDCGPDALKVDNIYKSIIYKGGHKLNKKTN